MISWLEKNYFLQHLFCENLSYQMFIYAVRVYAYSPKSIYLQQVTKILLSQQLITWCMQINNHHRKERKRIYSANNTRHNNVTHAFIYNI